MSWMRTRRHRMLVLAMFVGISGMAAIGAVVPPSLNPQEAACIGSWWYISPDHNSPTLIVYHFSPNRAAREEHYQLTSATPTVPRITFLGQWQVESGGRLVVKPSRGLRGAVTKASGVVRDALNDTERLPRPVLTRYYQVLKVQAATADGLTVECNRSGGEGRIEIVMQPFHGDTLSKLAAESRPGTSPQTP